MRTVAYAHGKHTAARTDEYLFSQLVLWVIANNWEPHTQPINEYASGCNAAQASNYHVLNSITLWDKPAVSPQINGRTKSAIRTDWRTARRSAYNYRREAAGAYRALLAILESERAALEGHPEQWATQTVRHQPCVEGQFACEESRPGRPAALP